MDSSNIEKEVIENDAATQRYVNTHSRSINLEDWWEKPLVLVLVAFVAYKVWGLRGLGPVAIITLMVIVWLLDKTGFWSLVALIVGIIALIVYGHIAWQVV